MVFDKKITLSEFKELPFGANILVHIIIPTLNRDETYKAVIIRDKIYYEDGKVDDRRTIEEYMYNGWAIVYNIPCANDNVQFSQKTVPTKTIYYSTVNEIEVPEDMTNHDIDNYIKQNFPEDTMWSFSEADFYNL